MAGEFGFGSVRSDYTSKYTSKLSERNAKIILPGLRSKLQQCRRLGYTITVSKTRRET